MHMCMGKVSLWGIKFKVNGAGCTVQGAGCTVHGAGGAQGELVMLKVYVEL